MKKIIQILNKLSTKKYNKYIMGAFFISSFLIKNDFFGQGHLAEITGGLRMIDMKFFNTSNQIIIYLQSLRQTGRESYLLLLGLDMLLIVSFFLMQGTLAIKLLRGVNAVDEYQWIVFIPLAQSVMDAFENFAMMVNTIIYPAQVSPALTIAKYATPAKWVFMWLNVSILVYLILLNIVARFKQLVKSQHKPVYMNDVVVTGANNGIGFYITKKLLEDGYHVATLDISNENLKPLLEYFPDRLLIYKCDITDSIQVKKVVDEVYKEWGKIDILINNACIAIFKSFEEKTVKETNKEFEINYFGYINTIKAVLPYMKEKGGGIIHNVSSGVGITGFPGIFGYASTKGAIESLTRTLSLEFQKYGISVNLMHPPLTNTKSSAPLGIPAEAMDNPERVGQKLAKRILSRKPVITIDFRSTVFLFFAYRFPLVLGRLITKISENA